MRVSTDLQPDDKRDRPSLDSDLSDRAIAAAVARLRLRLRVEASRSGRGQPLRPRDLAE